MKQTVVLFILQLLCKLPGGSDDVYTNAALAEAIISYAEGEGVVTFLEKNRDVSPEIVQKYLELRFSHLRMMSFRSAEYFLLHWKTIRELWNEAKLIHRKASSLTEEALTGEKARLKNLCATLGHDRLSLQYANEISSYAFSRKL